MFSPFHFHRVFKAITGETLFGFIHRLRIEKAAGALTNHPDRSVLEVALDHGFGSAATFARAFKAHFGMSATEWREGGALRWRPRRVGPDAPRHRRAERRGAYTMTVRVREFPTRHVAYMRYVGPYGEHGIPELWTRLVRWMQARDLCHADTIRLGVAYDDPRITAADKCRYDACLVVPEGFEPDRWVNVMDAAGDRCAVAAFKGTAAEIEDAWDRVFASWLPKSGYQPDDRPCFEVYRGDPMVGHSALFRCELCLPVRPL